MRRGLTMGRFGHESQGSAGRPGDRPGSRPMGSRRPEPSARPLQQADMNDVLRIEKSCFPSAWTRGRFRRTLAIGSVRGFAVEVDGAVLGFYVLESGRHRVHVLNLAVDPAFRRRGLGTFILGEIDEFAVAEERRWVELEVRESNLAAQLLYRKAGYRAIEILRKYYGEEDGYLMRHEPAGS